MITLQPSSQDDAARIDDLADEQREVYQSLNESRWNDFAAREKVFEKTTNNLPETTLPEATEQVLLNANAKDWENHIYHAVKTAHIARMKSSDIIASEDVWFNKTALAEPVGKFPELCVTSDALVISDETVTVTTKTEPVEFTITNRTGETSDFTDGVVYIYEDGDEFVLENHTFYRDTSYAIPISAKTKTKDHQAVLRTLSVAASVTPVAQVEPLPENPAFPELFEEIGLYWTEVEHTENQLDTYLVGTHDRGKERIKAFLATDSSERTLEQYCDLLGYPTSVSDYYGEYDPTGYDRYSSEEFVLYALLSGELQEEDAKYILHAPYRPPPSKKEVRRAIQFAKQFKAGLTIMQNEAPTKNDSDTIKNQYESYYSQYTRQRRKPVLEVYTCLVEATTLHPEQSCSS